MVIEDQPARMVLVREAIVEVVARLHGLALGLSAEELVPGLFKSDNKYSSIASLYCFLL